MRNIDINYYKVYYYCNILDNLLNLFFSGPDWISTGAQFTEPFFEGEIENFPKYSALHAFCEFAVGQLIYEDASKDIETIQERYDSAIIENKAKRLQHAFNFNNEYTDNRLEVDRLLNMYGIKHQTFYAYLLENDFEFMEDAYQEFIAFDADVENSIHHLARELFYILFQNRDFLYRFNLYMSNANPHTIKRCNIPLWVKRAVHYRDRGRCVMCRKDLSGTFDCEDTGAVHYDHIISLHSGGLNDVCNIQLMCSSCNLEKSSGSYTSRIYKDWYDFDSD